MIKTIFASFVVISLFSMSSFAAGSCAATAANAVQNALRNTQYMMGNLQNEGGEMYSAEVLLRSGESYVGNYIVRLNPETCAVLSAQFEQANP